MIISEVQQPIGASPLNAVVLHLLKDVFLGVQAPIVQSPKSKFLVWERTLCEATYVGN